MRINERLMSGRRDATEITMWMVTISALPLVGPVNQMVIALCRRGQAQRNPIFMSSSHRIADQDDGIHAAHTDGRASPDRINHLLPVDIGKLGGRRSSPNHVAAQENFAAPVPGSS